MSDEMLVLGLIVVSALTLGIGIFLLKNTTRPKHEDDDDR
jgi:hypothetical protein